MIIVMRILRNLSATTRWTITSVVVWSLTKQMFVAIKMWGIESTPLRVMDVSPYMLWLTVALSGMLDGLMFSIADRQLDKRVKLPFPAMVMVKSMAHAMLAFTLTASILPLVARISYTEGLHALLNILLSSHFIVSFLYIFATTLLLQAAQQLSNWLHQDNLMALFSEGKLIEEERIFLFLDMRSSTSMAESLGAMRYSLLVQDCFRDLAMAVQETGALIYQYVGDEAVLTWTSSPGNFSKAVRMYFRFSEILEQRAQHYKIRYGVVPRFKGGIHYGSVVKTQVGVVHKALAFHGDAINTASRIQDKCSELMRDLLISESFRQQLPNTVSCEWEGIYNLRGKEANMSLYSVQRSCVAPSN